MVWLWDAGRASGVTDNEMLARQRAGARLRAGQADTARIESAVAEMGLRTMTCGYQRTGSGWQARRGPRGGFRWMPLPGGPG